MDQNRAPFCLDAPDPETFLEVLEDADALLGIDPATVATVDPLAFVTRWQRIRPRVVLNAIPADRARSILYRRAA